ncbi:MAG: hypothetical protein HW411_1450 [Gammaproteobacteria bacterium]|nr:hypothetical protein [Gammaproteobacteria bacterium]
MPDKKLQKDLEKLRAEIDNVAADDHETREKLNRLISGLETKLENPDDENHHHTLLRNIKATIGYFETEHPRATAILNDIMVTLSNMGI